MNISRIISCLLLSSFIFGCGQEAVETGNSNIKLFTHLESSKTGILFNNHLEESPERHYVNFNPIYDGGGVAIGDINNDELPDIYFTGNEVPNKLYLNKGNLKFEDITASAGVGGGGGWHNGVAMVDINYDGLLDIYVCRGGWHKDPALRTNLLFINKGDLKFEEEAAKYGLADPGYSFQSTFFDYDKDGDLDVYVINHPEKSNLGIAEYLEGHKNGPVHSKDRLYRNQGNNTFKDVTDEAGMGQTFGFGLGVSTADLDNNGYLDVYVTNDYIEADYMFLNNGDGTFTESVKDRMRHISVFSMGIDIADLDHDGQEDIFITEMLPKDYKRSKINMAAMNPKGFFEMVDNGFHYCYMHNVLQKNLGNGHFSEVSQLAGLSKTDWSWACFLSDFDNDGLRDVFVANGYRRDIFDRDAERKMTQFFEEHRKQNKPGAPDINEVMDIYHSEKLENHIYKNNGDLNFSYKTKDWGLDVSSFSNGASIGDLDNDGDLDLVINNLNQEAFVFRNNGEKSGNNYLKIKLEGPQKNPHGFGAKVILNFGEKMQMEQFKISRGYLGTVEPKIYFGLGKASQIDEVKVEWLDGKVSTIQNVACNAELTISYKDATGMVAEKAKSPTLFREVTNEAFAQPFVHQENDYDDFKTQILLPHKLSQLGPFIAVADVNGDELEDFYVGGAANQAGRLYIQNIGGFQAKNMAAFTKDKAHEDMGVLFFDADGDGDQDLYVVSGGVEFPEGSDNYQDRLYLNDGAGNFTKSSGLPKFTTSGSCVAAGDFEGDGDLDLFVGGRSIPDRYPLPVSSHILINDGGTFTDQTSATASNLRLAGMVTTAIWSDFDKNGSADLILAGEWMPVKFMKNEGGKLKDVTSSYVSDDLTGWWNRIIESDIDGDGDLDYIAGNLGKNYKFKASKEKPFHIYCNDFDNNGSFDVVLAKYYGDKQVPVRGRECSSQQMPFVAEKFPTFHEFADAGINDIYGDGLNAALHYEAQWFASTLFLNESDTFLVKKLPLEAQYSTVQGIIAEDFDQDGKTDIILGGNLYHAEVETTRADASVGLFLKNEGGHSLSSTSVNESGFFIPYDVKDLQLIKIGKEGSNGVLVGSNDGVLRLFVAGLEKQDL